MCKQADEAVGHIVSGCRKFAKLNTLVLSKEIWTTP